jgi:hypothetical protein
MRQLIMEHQDDSLLQKLCEAFREARNNGKLHVDLDEFHKQLGELGPNATLEVLKKEVKNGIIEIDNKQIRPTPLGIERSKLDKSLYS